MTNEEIKKVAQGLITDFKTKSDTIVDFCEGVIKALEQTRWIPCSERLPEEDEWVLITYDNEIEIALLDDDGWCYSAVGDDDWIAEHPPIAWMPLPQPYAESEEV